MHKLTIFWEEKSSPYFRWYLDSGIKSLSDSSIETRAELESHEILKNDLALLTDLAKGKKVELILSNQDIHFNQVELPAKAQRHITKAIPYLIEESLAEPVDDLFIAVGEKKEQKTPVRGINRNYLNSLIQSFQSNEINLSAIYIDLDCIGKSESSYSVIINQETALITQKDENNQNYHHVWSCQLNEFSWLVQKQLAELDEELPVAIPMQIISANLQQAEIFQQQLPMSRFASEIISVDSIEEYLLANDSQSTRINLLQAEFAIKQKNSGLRIFLTQVASLIGLVLFAYVFYQGSQWFTLNSEYEKLKQQKSVLWKQAFPNKKYRESKAEKSFRNSLKELSGGQGDSAFLPMLSSVIEKIDNLQQLYPTNISYDSVRNEIRLDLIAKELDILNSYKEALQKINYQVESGSATTRGDGYSSRVIVRKNKDNKSVDKKNKA